MLLNYILAAIRLREEICSVAYSTVEVTSNNLAYTLIVNNNL